MTCSVFCILIGIYRCIRHTCIILLYNYVPYIYTIRRSRTIITNINNISTDQWITDDSNVCATNYSYLVERVIIVFFCSYLAGEEMVRVLKMNVCRHLNFQIFICMKYRQF